MTLDELTKLPRHLVQRFYDTACASVMDAHKGLCAVQLEMEEPQALLIDPGLIERRDTLQARYYKNYAFLCLCDEALHTRRNALTRVGLDDFMDEPA